MRGEILLNVASMAVNPHLSRILKIFRGNVCVYGFEINCEYFIVPFAKYSRAAFYSAS